MRLRRKEACGIAVGVMVVALGVSGYRLCEVTRETDRVISELSENVKELEGNVQRLKKEKDELKGTIDEFRKKNSELGKELRVLRKHYDEYIEELKDRKEYDEYCVEILARIIYAEAGNQKEFGKYAVALVVRNRVDADEFPDTYEEVIFQKSQFCGSTTDNFNDEIPEDCYEIARKVFNREEGYVIPSNVLYFKTVRCDAEWDLPLYQVIQDHEFYYGE